MNSDFTILLNLDLNSTDTNILKFENNGVYLIYHSTEDGMAITLFFPNEEVEFISIPLNLYRLIIDDIKFICLSWDNRFKRIKIFVNHIVYEWYFKNRIDFDLDTLFITDFVNSYVILNKSVSYGELKVEYENSNLF